MNTDQARQRAENSFKQQEVRAPDAQTATSEYETRVRDIREKTARLRALRLAKETEARTEAPG